MAEFGSDLSTFPDLDVKGTQISETRSVVECCLRRLITPIGALSYDPEFGYDLRDLLNDDLTDAELVRHASRVEIEIEKDERVRSASASLAWDPVRPFTLVVRVTATLIDDRTFDFTAAISQLDVSIFSA